MPAWRLSGTVSAFRPDRPDGRRFNGHRSNRSNGRRLDRHRSDRADGSERWVLNLPGPLWQSPVVVDSVLIQGDCEGFLHAFDLSEGTPVEMWTIELGGCIESTPAVWNGQVFVGSRNGTFYAIG